MSEDVQHSPPKGWKAFQVNYDYVFEQSDRLCSVCLTQQEITAMLSMTEYLYWPTRWVKAADDVERTVVEHFAQTLERHLLMPCCDDNIPIQFRYTPEGTLQKSYNAGGTWVDCPENDPRVYSPTFPPMPGADDNDKKCIAATGMAALIKEQVGDQLTDDMSRYTLSQLIKDWVATMIQSSNPFQALVTVAVNQIFALVIALLIPALTETVYDTLKCIFYCRMAADASFTQARLENVTSDIGDQIGGIATLFLQQLVNLLGPTGLTNLARAGGAATGDCSACGDCLGCSERWTVFGGAHGTIINQTDEYVDVLASDGGNGNFYVILKTANADTCCMVDHTEDLSGSFSLHGWTDCGQTQVEGAPQHTGLGWGTCINYFQAQSATPFTVRVFFVDC